MPAHPVSFKPPNGRLRAWLQSPWYCPSCGNKTLWRQVAARDDAPQICTQCKTPSVILRPKPSGEQELIAGRLGTEPMRERPRRELQ